MSLGVRPGLGDLGALIFRRRPPGVDLRQQAGPLLYELRVGALDPLAARAPLEPVRIKLRHPLHRNAAEPLSGDALVQTLLAPPLLGDPPA